LVRELRDSGVTIILTTHYIEEAEDMADRVGVMSKGELILVKEKSALMRKLGKKQLTLELSAPLETVPPSVAGYDIALASEGRELVYTYDTKAERTGITTLLEELKRAGVGFKDLRTTQSSLEDIFVDLTSR
ncbi:MAG: type transport system ATP-binding protein, partial [Methylobacteriaceae bacterium]|nr:type transport system ATP-binding protein [Methylobacteriaceae bacterium]